MSIQSSFRDTVFGLIDQLQGTAAESQALAAQGAAFNATTSQEVVQIFRKLAEGLEIRPGQYHQISEHLNSILDDEEKRIAQASRKRTLEEVREKDDVGEAPSAKRAKVIGTAGEIVASEPEESKVDTQVGKESAFTELEGLTVALEEGEIAKYLTDEERGCLFQRLATKEGKRARDALCIDLLPVLADIAADDEIPSLYESVIGEPFPLPSDIFQKRDEAIRKNDTSALREIDETIANGYRKLRQLESEGTCVAKELEEYRTIEELELFRAIIDPSQVLHNKETLKHVLHAIRAHNLELLALSLPNFPSAFFDKNLRIMGHPVEEEAFYNYYNSCEEVAEWLVQNGSRVTLLTFYWDLTRLPLEVTRLTNLRQLRFMKSVNIVIPAQISSLDKLEEISLSDMGLSEIPNWVFGFSNLKTLSLLKNKLTTLPPQISMLSKLECLDVRRNPLTCLPEVIWNLPNLKTLRITRDQAHLIPSKYKDKPLVKID